jgi:hypothetical protein
MDFLDPTIMQRDPSFDPNTNTFDAIDPSSPTFFHQVAAILGSGQRLARPAIWEQLNTLTGRRLRDSFMPGSGTLSLAIMQKMRGVKLCESTAPSHTPGGLNQLGYATGGACQPIGERARPASAQVRTTTPVVDGVATRVDGNPPPATMLPSGDAGAGLGSTLPLGDAGAYARGAVCRVQTPQPPVVLHGSSRATTAPQDLIGDAAAGFSALANPAPSASGSAPDACGLQAPIWEQSSDRVPLPLWTTTARAESAPP